MNILDAFFLGVIEGITEFLPISSTGHLIVASNWLSIDQTETNKSIEVVIQLAAILAVFTNYRDKFTSNHMSLWIKVMLAFLPIGIVGLLFHRQIEMLFTVPVVGTMFIIGGIVFLLLELSYKERSIHVNVVEEITYKQAFLVGVAQVFALVPGTSRAGASIVGALLVGVNRKASAEFSFLLALPVLGAAAGFDLLKHYKSFGEGDIYSLLLGFVISFFVAYLTIRLFIGFLQKFTFVAFGIYRIVFGALLLWLA